MKRFRHLLLTICIFGIAAPIMAQAPNLFAKQLLTEKVEYGFTITPDEKTAYFVKRDSFYVSTPSTIYKSHWENGNWTTPVVASFSGKYSDSSPFLSPDGKRFFFTSRRPVDGKEVDSANIWYVDLKNGKESEAIALTAVNSNKSEYSPTVDKAGNLYFGSYRAGGEGWGDIWMSEYKNGAYQTPVNLGATINSSDGEWGSCIAPDGTYLIFENSGKEQNLSASGDLYISFKENGQWQTPIHFPTPINSIGSDLTPKIHKDQLYYASNRPKEGELGWDMNNVDIYRISIQELLKYLR